MICIISPHTIWNLTYGISHITGFFTEIKILNGKMINIYFKANQDSGLWL